MGIKRVVGIVTLSALIAALPEPALAIRPVSVVIQQETYDSA